jgi:hypothetical protein
LRWLQLGSRGARLGIALAEFNGNPTVRKLVLDLADGYLAHGRQDANGSWTFPEEINASTEESRGVLSAKSRGMSR